MTAFQLPQVENGRADITGRMTPLFLFGSCIYRIEPENACRTIGYPSSYLTLRNLSTRDTDCEADPHNSLLCKKTLEKNSVLKTSCDCSTSQNGTKTAHSIMKSEMPFLDLSGPHLFRKSEIRWE